MRWLALVLLAGCAQDRTVAAEGASAPPDATLLDAGDGGPPEAGAADTGPDEAEPPRPLQVPPAGCAPGPCRIDHADGYSTHQTFDAEGRLLEQRLGLGEETALWTRWQWEGWRVVEKRTTQADGETVTRLTSTWRAGHRVESRRHRDGGEVARAEITHRWEDDLYWEREVWTRAGESQPQVSFTRTFDGQGRLVSLAVAPHADEVTRRTVITWAPDGLSRRLQFWDFDVALPEAIERFDACGRFLEGGPVGSPAIDVGVFDCGE